MKQKFFLLSLLLFQFVFAFTQIRLDTDSTVMVYPHWHKDDHHSIIVNCITDDFEHGKSRDYQTTFQATFIVLEKDTSSYTIEWTYTDAKLALNDINLENNILAQMVNRKFLIKITRTGRFVTLINGDTIKEQAEKILDTLILGSENDRARSVQFKLVKQLISTQKGLELVLLKQMKFYNLSFGFKYKTNFTQINKVRYPNPFGGDPFDADEFVRLTNLDRQNKICIIETSKNIKSDELKNALVKKMKKLSPNDIPSIEKEIQKQQMESSESTMQQIDYSEGIVQKATYTLKQNLGNQKRILTVKIQSTD